MNARRNIAIFLLFVLLGLFAAHWGLWVYAYQKQAQHHEAELAAQAARTESQITEARYRGWADNCIGVGVTMFRLPHEDAETVCYKSVAEQAAKGKVVGTQWAVHWVWPPSKASMQEASDVR